MNKSPSALALGVTVMPEWFQAEGIEPVLDRLQALGATALATSPYLLEIAPDGQGAREPPPDGEAGRVRPLDRSLWGRQETWVRTAPSLVHDLGRYRGLRYQPSPPGELTYAQPRLIDDVIDAARRRGMVVYLQVMAASPPGYRVQFSSAVDADQCLGPDGQAHPHRVDKNASLASPEVHAYGAALLRELAERYPGLHGLRVDWPEYPPYDLRSALFDFSPDGQRALQEQGVDATDYGHRLTRLLAAWRQAAQHAAPLGPAALRGRLRDAGWDDFFAPGGAGEPLWASKRQSVGRLMKAFRQGLDQVPGARRSLEPQVFPFPMSHWSGFDWASLGETSQAVGVKLYTMHWPMIARYWARDLLDAAPQPQALDNATEALARWMALVDGPPAAGQRLEYPPPDTPHPVGAQAQSDKLRQAQVIASPVPVIGFAHSYGPDDDVLQRVDLATRACSAEGGSGRVWINRYGYLSDAKLARIGELVRSQGPVASWGARD